LGYADVLDFVINREREVLAGIDIEDIVHLGREKCDAVEANRIANRPDQCSSDVNEMMFVMLYSSSLRRTLM
jgi:hypothetical protein